MSEAQETASTSRAIAPRRSIGLHLTVTAVLATLLFLMTTVASWMGIRSVLDEVGLAQLRLDIARLALTVVAALGGLVALVVALRRQRVLEEAHDRELDASEYARLDSTERRNTELYARAVEEIGHENAAVRLGGMYSLTRLAQSYPSFRQNVIDVMCAYLRMPYQPPADLPLEFASEDNTANRFRAGSPVSRLSSAANGSDRTRQEELQVRLAVQALILQHASVTDEPIHWPGLRIDLSRAVLIDFSLSSTRLSKLVCNDAVFLGGAWFSQLVVTGAASFRGADFEYVTFDSSEFRSGIDFNGALFRHFFIFDGVSAPHSTFQEVHFASAMRIPSLGSDAGDKDSVEHAFIGATVDTSETCVRMLPEGVSIFDEAGETYASIESASPVP